MITREIRRRLRDEYRYTGFYTSRYVEVARWDHEGRVIRLTRRSKKRYVEHVAGFKEGGMTVRYIERGTCHARVCVFISNLRFADYDARRAVW